MDLYLFLMSVVQAITEFLPVSSSTHLSLLARAFDQHESVLEWEVALHVGTLCAVVVYFWKDLWRMTVALFSGATHDTYFKEALWLIVATLPCVVGGYVIKRSGDIVLSSFAMGILMITFGVALYVADRLRPSDKPLTALSALGIGGAQVLAFIPCVSRSGICLTAARIFGISRCAAIRFTFLLSIPVVLGAATLTLKDAIAAQVPLDWLLMFQVAMLTFALSLFVIRGAFWMMGRYGFLPFMVYRILLGAWLIWGCC